MQIYATFNGAMVPVELRAGEDAPLFWQQVADAAEATEYAAQIGAYVRFDHLLPAAALPHAWGADDLTRHRIQIVAVDDPPAGKVLESLGLHASGETISASPTYVDRPATPRPQLPKSTVMARVFALGFNQQVAALFAANFELQAKWFTPDWPNVYADDEGLLAALSAMGMSDEQIASVTALT